MNTNNIIKTILDTKVKYDSGYYCKDDDSEATPVEYIEIGANTDVLSKVYNGFKIETLADILYLVKIYGDDYFSGAFKITLDTNNNTDDVISFAKTLFWKHFNWNFCEVSLIIGNQTFKISNSSTGFMIESKMFKKDYTSQSLFLYPINCINFSALAVSYSEFTYCLKVLSEFLKDDRNNTNFRISVYDDVVTISYIECFGVTSALYVMEITPKHTKIFENKNLSKIICYTDDKLALNEPLSDDFEIYNLDFAVDKSTCGWNLSEMYIGSSLRIAFTDSFETANIEKRDKVAMDTCHSKKFYRISKGSNFSIYTPAEIEFVREAGKLLKSKFNNFDFQKPFIMFENAIHTINEYRAFEKEKYIENRDYVLKIFYRE